jgi:CelD/BcsL family acetyltransferase involved in cellulose biosynthesis
LRKKGAEVSDRQSAPFIDLAGVGSPKLQAERYSAKDRKNRRRHRKRLGEQGAVAFEWLHPSAEAAALAVNAVALKRQWLARRGRISKAFTDRRIEQFLAATVAGATPNLDGRVGVIRSGGRTAAVLVGFVNKGCYAGFLTAYDGDFERYSPGSLLFEDVIGASIGEGLARIDLLAPADRYKQAWSDGEVPVEDLCLPLSAGGSIYTRIIQRRLRHSLKSSIESMPPVLRRTLLYAVALLPALLYASSDP